MIGENVQIIGSGVPVVDVVGMLPDIDGEQGLEPVSQWVSSVAGVHDLKIIVPLGQPGPS